MKKFIASFVLVLACAFSFQAFAEGTRTAKMACTNFPPYKIEDKDESENHRGIDLEVVRAAFRESSIDADFKFYPWKRTVAMVERGQADALCGCAYREEREEKFIYSDMLGSHSQGIFLSETSTLQTVETLDQLNGRNVGVVRGYALHKELLEKPEINVMEASDDEQLLRLLLADRVDAIYSYRDIILYRLSFNRKAKKVRYFEMNAEPYYLCFSRQIPEAEKMVDDFNKGLRIIRHNGIYSDIWDRYR